MAYRDMFLTTALTVKLTSQTVLAVLLLAFSSHYIHIRDDYI